VINVYYNCPNNAVQTTH